MAALVAVHDFRMADFERITASIQNKVNFEAIAYAPGQDIPGKPVNNGHQIKPDGTDRDIGDVDRPDLIWMEMSILFNKYG